LFAVEAVAGSVHRYVWALVREIRASTPNQVKLSGQPHLNRKERAMRKLIVNEFLSLDGVAQAPGAPDEDTSGGFKHGGWSIPYMDEFAQKSVLGAIVDAGAFVLGRRTYEIFAGYWPNAPEEERVIAEPLNTKPKYVASRTLSEPLEWQNSQLIEGDLAEAITSLKQETAADLHVIGSLELVQTLLDHNLVDELRLMIDPIVVGGGKRIFRDDGVIRPLQLVNSQVTSTGAMLATYAPVEASGASATSS
jgi:dihydrofolate reductase